MPGTVKVCLVAHLELRSLHRVPVQTSVHGSVLLENFPSTTSRRFIANNGVTDCRTNIPLSILVNNPSPERGTFQKGRR